MLQGKELILATKPFASEDRSKSWWLTLSTFFILIISLAGTYFNFHISLKIKVFLYLTNVRSPLFYAY
jgi:omega-6 fatty acid desaturase (delta-12 desaturase)